MIDFRQFDNFIKMQLFVIFVISFGWALILPVLTKLQGLLWSTSIISLYMIFNKLTAFITPYFKHTSLKASYKKLIILDGIYFLSLPLFFVNHLLFLYFDSVLMVIYGIFLTVFGINYDAFLMNTYKTNIFKEIQYAERIVMAIAGIFGYLVVILLDSIHKDMENVIYTFLVILFFNVIIQIYNYKVHWKNL